MFKVKKKYCLSALAVLVMVVGLTASTTVPVASADNDNNIVFPPGSKPFGKTYGEWSANWWQWIFSIPAATNPANDPTGANCGVGQSGKVWFLAASSGGLASRSCTVPRGKALFFPILTGVFGASVLDCEPTVPGVACDVIALRATVAQGIDCPKFLEVRLDGQLIPHPNAYRAQSPVFPITLPEGALGGLTPAGTWTPNVADGFWMMLEPLSPGLHTLSFKGETNFGFAGEARWNLTITNHGND